MQSLPSKTVCSCEPPPLSNIKLELQQTPFNCQDAFNSENIKIKRSFFLCFLAHWLHFITRDVKYNILHIALPKSDSLHVTQSIRVLLAANRSGKQKPIQRLFHHRMGE